MTEWFQKKPGAPAINVEPDGTVAAIIGGPPDWVRLPPELGGAQVRVLGTHSGPCPKCGAPSVTHLELPDNLGVAECKTCGFCWYRRRPA